MECVTQTCLEKFYNRIYFYIFYVLALFPSLYIDFFSFFFLNNKKCKETIFVEKAQKNEDIIFYLMIFSRAYIRMYKPIPSKSNILHALHMLFVKIIASNFQYSCFKKVPLFMKNFINFLFIFISCTTCDIGAYQVWVDVCYAQKGSLFICRSI